MTIEQVILLLKDEIAKVGSQFAFAKAHGISAQYVSDVVLGRREPGEKILAALGLRKVVTYEASGGRQKKR